MEPLDECAACGADLFDGEPHECPVLGTIVLAELKEPFAEIAGDAILVSNVASYKIREIPGSRFHAKADGHSSEPHWTLPLAWASCLAMRGVWGPKLQIGEELRQWATLERTWRIDPALALRDKLTTTHSADLPLPEGLYGYQEVGAMFLATAWGAILADEPGAGKTAQAIAALRVAESAPILIVAPNSMLYTWREEFARWWPEATVAIATGSALKRRAAIESGSDVVVISWENLRRHTRLAGFGSAVAIARCSDHGGFATEKQCEAHPRELNAVSWNAVIADEAHRAKNPIAKQTRALWAVSEKAERRFALTGTPILNSPIDLWSLGRFVSPSEFPTRTAWIDRYCDAGQGLWGGIEIFGLKESTKHELFGFVDPRFLRRTKDIILPQLPPKTYSMRTVPLVAKQRRAYDEMRKQMLAELDSGMVIVTDPLSKLIRLRQFAAAYAEVEVTIQDDGSSTSKVTLAEPSSKIDALVDVVDGLGGKAVVVFAESKQLIDMAGARITKVINDSKSSVLRDYVGSEVGYITGSVGLLERKRTIEQFQDGEIRILCATLGAGGEGITLTAADTLVFLQKSFSRAKNLQAEDRIHRVGQEAEHVEIITILSENTVETHLEDVLRDKAAISEEIVRDAETFRRFLS